MAAYETVIGLEFHVELKTKTKIFCGCPTSFAGEANTQVCPICLGLPGVLPALNRKAVEMAVRAGLGLHCDIVRYSKFDRKNYFYPDLPKGYQVTQFLLPICKNGYIEIPASAGGTKKVRINRIHLEEDAGKLVHSGNTIASSAYSLADYNRAAVPLIEIVTEPDLSSAEEARAFGEKLKLIMEYADVSDVKMEQGSLRCDVNISLRPIGRQELGVKAEIKNLNSFRAAYRAIQYEEERQRKRLDRDEPILQETRTWDDDKGETLSMRSKEEAHDYRYFPEPDLTPIMLSEEWIQKVAETLPQMPDERALRLQETHGLSEYDSGLLVATPALAFFFDEVVTLHNAPKTIANWLLGDLTRLLKESDEEDGEDGEGDLRKIPIAPAHMADLLESVRLGDINMNSAKIVLEEMFTEDKDPAEIIREKGFAQISDTGELESLVKKAVEANPQAIEDYKQGKAQALGFLVGQVMRETKGQANPQAVRDILLGLLQ